MRNPSPFLIVFPVGAALFSACNSTAKSSKEAQTNQKPNVIYLISDDLGIGDLSCYGATKISTPNLDRLAGQGLQFTNAYATSSTSTPSRFGLLTGMYPWRQENTGIAPGNSELIIDTACVTMADMFQAEGYATAAIGKWHLGWDWDNIDAGKDKVDFSKPVQNGPTTRGFDYFYGFCGSLDMAPYVYIENDMPTSLPDRETVNEGKYSWWRKGPTGADFVHEEVLPNLVDRACNYIKEKAKADQPYFLYLPLPAPHTPILPTEEFRGKSGIGEYGDFVLMVDAMVGKVLQAVKESGEDGNTIVVFTTDNGCSPAAGIKEMEAQGHRPNSIYRGHKADLFDGGHRIPCILRWPEGTKPHEVRQTVCLTDFYATFAAINGYKLMDSEGEDSYNLLPAIVSETEIDPIREATVHHSIDGQFTIRQGDWKLLLSASSGGWSAPTPTDTLALDSLPPIQLYNMKYDPSETTNVEAEHPEIVSRLRALMAKYVREGRSTPGAPQKNDGEYPWKELDWMKE